VEHHAQKELGEVTNPIFEVLLPGIDPFNLFLSNLRSTRFGSFPNSDGFFPVNPFEWKFLHDMKKKHPSVVSSDIKDEATLESNKCENKIDVPYITLTLPNPPNSDGIGPVSRLTLKSRTLNLLSDAHEAADADFFALLVLVDGVGIWKTRRDKPVDPLATSAPAAAHARRTGRRRDGV